MNLFMKNGHFHISFFRLFESNLGFLLQPFSPMNYLIQRLCFQCLTLAENYRDMQLAPPSHLPPGLVCGPPPPGLLWYRVCIPFPAQVLPQGGNLLLGHSFPQSLMSMCWDKASLGCHPFVLSICIWPGKANIVGPFQSAANQITVQSKSPG